MSNVSNMPQNVSSIDEQVFLEKLAQGEKVELTDPMPEMYRESLINLMTQQADSELSGGYGYIPWIEKAPNIHEKLLVSQIVKDEIGHAYRMYKLLEELGEPVEERITAMNAVLSERVATEEQVSTERRTQDKRVNIFFYPIETWTDFIMFNFCMDRGAGHQLEDALECSYAPWSRAIKQIFKEEMMHVTHGNQWVQLLSGNPETRAEVQEALNKWYPRTMDIFGHPHSKKNALYRKFGLKKRSNDEVRQAFKADIEQALTGTGLTLPEWTPNYDLSV